MLENREQYEWALSRVEALVNDVGYKPVKSHFFLSSRKRLLVRMCLGVRSVSGRVKVPREKPRHCG